MDLTDHNIIYLGEFIEGFLFGEISVLPTVAPPPFLKNQQPGLYSGIFVLYWLCVSKKGTYLGQNIIFYSLCVLYVLSAVVFGSDIGCFVAGSFVSNIEHIFLF